MIWWSERKLVGRASKDSRWTVMEGGVMLDLLVIRRVQSTLVGLALATVLSTWGIKGHAELKGAIEPQEIALLPNYCPHTLTFRAMLNGPQEEQDYWLKRLGPTFKSMHHYCWALIAMQRAIKPGLSMQERRFNYQSAVDDIDFVLRHADDSFPLLPEILTRKGEAQTRLKDFGGAESSFMRAIQLKEDYWPAYRGLAQAKIDQGRRDAAKAVLERGLTRVSETRVLRRMLDDLGSR